MIPAGCGGQARGGNQSENLVAGEGETSINKIGVCGRSSLQRGLNSQLVPRATPELSKASLTPSTRPLSASGLVGGGGGSGRMKIGVCRHCFAEGPKRRGERRTHQTYPLRVEAVSNPPLPPPSPTARACNFPLHGAVSRTETSASRPGETGRPPLTRPCPATNPPSVRTWEPVLSHAGAPRRGEPHSSSVGH